MKYILLGWKAREDVRVDELPICIEFTDSLWYAVRRAVILMDAGDWYKVSVAKLVR